MHVFPLAFHLKMIAALSTAQRQYGTVCTNKSSKLSRDSHLLGPKRP